MASLRVQFLLAIGAALVVTGCASHPSSTVCKTGIVCPAPLQCAAVQAVCIENNCGNGLPDVGEECDDGNIMDGDGCSHNCTMETCGNHVMDSGEECDDGNNVAGDGCSPTCKIERCGNHIVDPGEACDDGNTSDTDALGNPDGCSADCKSNQMCGNCIVDTVAGEVCDDCNTTSGDACESDCKSGVGCGNGFTDPNEQCDDGNRVDDDDCKNDCTINTCGDHVVNDMGGLANREDCDPGTGGVPLETAQCNIDCSFASCGDGKINHSFTPTGAPGPEQCDNGGANADDTDCTSLCQTNVCGDGIPDTNGPGNIEACDTGGASQTCNADCTVPACGDGKVNAQFTPTGAPGPEQCDDSNTNDGDGCSSKCQLEHCGNGQLDPGEQCDPPGTAVGGFQCSAACQLEKCGNGILDPGEQCDDGNSSDNDDCLSSNATPSMCKKATCGDGITDNFREQCDHGANNGKAGDTCSATCHTVTCGNGLVEQGEQCDNGVGNNADNKDCTSTCQVNVCGDTHADTLGPTHTETCDTGTASQTCNADCTAPMCGDGKVNHSFTPSGAAGPEQCDDGNTNDGDGCSSKCQLEHCGNNHLDPGEQCDPPGTAVGGFQCSASCQLEKCGNGILDPGEECDDNNTSDNDDCLSSNPAPTSCKKATCGDGKRDTAREDCDDGALNGQPGDTCDAQCKMVACGNGILEQGEECDDGLANSNTGGCIPVTCKRNVCGDGHKYSGVEECDSSGVDTASCNGATCTTPVCGDDHRNILAGEACDDGNLNGASGDPCGPFCDLVSCGNGKVDQGEECDPGTGTPATDSAGCNFDCTSVVCGDSHQNSVAGEMCDDGSANGTPCAYGDENCTRCNADCTGTTQPGGPFCGDNVTNGAETCDFGSGNGAASCAYGTASCPGCTSTCTTTTLTGNTCGDGNKDATHESCDDHNTSSCGLCSSDCQRTITASKASGVIVTSDGASLTPGQTFTIDDGFKPAVTYEFSTMATGMVLGNGHIAIQIVNTDTADQVATEVAGEIHAIHTAGSSFVDATSTSGNFISLLHDKSSSLGNNTIANSNAPSDWGTFGMSGGAGGDCLTNTGCTTAADCKSGVCTSNKCM